MKKDLIDSAFEQIFSDIISSDLKVAYEIDVMEALKIAYLSGVALPLRFTLEDIKSIIGDSNLTLPEIAMERARPFFENIKNQFED